MFTNKQLFFLILLCFFVIQTPAQKVGVVLSGGGAKGLAHIGVIKALEENDIPIDYITGTSIGAIVGGAYAIGYSPEQMQELFSSNEFHLWATGKLKEKDRYFFKKLPPTAEWIELNLAWQDSSLEAALPANIVPNHQMDLAFLRIMSAPAAAAHYDFDSLFVPFRCIAADPHNKKELILDNGHLPTAVRASMTFPFYFRPIRLDGNLVFDGGMENNFPADVMKNDFNPDYIIGSKVASNSKPPEPDDLYSQLNSMLLSKSNYSIPGEGLMIEPDVGGVSLMDFSKHEKLIQAGYEATLKQIDKIKKKVNRRVRDEQLYHKRRDFIQKFPSLIFRDIYITGLKPAQKKYAMRILRHDCDTLTYHQFRKGYFHLLADENIGAIYPRAVYNDTSGYFDLYLDIDKDKHFGAHLGGNISSQSLNQAYVGIDYKWLGLRSHFYSANVYLGRFYSSAALLGRVYFPGKIPFYTHLSLGINRRDFFRGSSDLPFADTKPSYIIQNERNIRFDLAFPIKYYGKFMAGAAKAFTVDEYYQQTNFTKSDTADKTNFDYWTFHTTYHENTLNHRQFANAGTNFKLQARISTGIEKHFPGSTSEITDEQQYKHSFFLLKTKYDNYFKLAKIFTLGTYFEATLSDKSFFNNYTATLLSNSAFQPTPFSKIMFLENFRADNYLAAGIRPIFTFNNFDIRMGGYFFLPFKKIVKNPDAKAEYGETFKNRSHMSNITLVYRTLVGPVSLGVHYFDRDEYENNVYFALNFGYMLFNKQGND